MQNGILTIEWAGIKSALILMVLTAVGAGITYVVGLGDVFLIDGHKLINVLALSLLVGAASLIQHFLTTNDDKFLGITKTN